MNVKKTLFMIVVVILSWTWSQSLEDLYFDNDSIVYMQVSTSCLSAIICISTQYNTGLWGVMHRKWGNIICNDQIQIKVSRRNMGPNPRDFRAVNSRMLSSSQQWDVTKPPSLVHLPGSLQGEIPSRGRDSIRCRPKNIPLQTILLICSSFYFPRVPTNVRKLLFCQAETARQIPCQNSLPSGLFHEEFDFQSVDCTDDSTHL